MIFAEASIINISTIIAFVLGIVAGVTLLISIFLIMVATDKKKNKKILEPTVEKFNEEQINNLVKHKQMEFTKLVEDDGEEYLKTCLALTKELLHEISSYYFPNSPYPEYELTVNEAADLIHYIVDSIMTTMDRPLLRQIKNVKISTIAGLTDTSRKISTSKTAKAVGKSGGAAGNARSIINALNPIMWFKKIVVNGTINIAVKKVCKSELVIAGREFEKVYSKSLFKENQPEDNDVSEKTKQDIEEIFSDEE